MFDTNSSRIWRADEYGKATRQNVLLLLHSERGEFEYDPYFGEAFYNDSFNSGIDYNKLLSNIKCNTLFMKAKTTIGADGLVQGALTDEDLKQVTSLIKNIEVEYFNCGHGIHSEKPKEFMRSVNETLRK